MLDKENYRQCWDFKNPNLKTPIFILGVLLTLIFCSSLKESHSQGGEANIILALESDGRPNQAWVKAIEERGLGTYFSLNETWIQPDGSLTKKATSTLDQLTPILSERLGRLKLDTRGHERGLREGLSTGAFEKKWGSLPVALWFSQLKSDSDRAIINQVSKGVSGMEELISQKLSDPGRSRQNF